MKPKTNLELKHYCTDFSAIRKILKNIGAEKIAIKNQKDYFFHLPRIKTGDSPRLKLRIEKDSKVLIYYERPKFQKGKDTTSKVKFYPVTDNQLLPFLKETLGIQATVEKKREIWKKGNTVFHLDIIKDIGNVFEIELRKTGAITQKDSDIFKSYQKQLDPYLGKIIKDSNGDLILKILMI
jgi:adenylate cyclase class IV